jgi:PKD repeat protein
VKVRRRPLGLVGSLVAAAVATVLVPATPVGASKGPVAGFSIDSGAGRLAVTFVAVSGGFPTAVDTYRWSFGDGKAVTTKTPTVTHSYPAASTFTPTLTEADAHGDLAAAKGSLALVNCPAGTTKCTASLGPAGPVQQVQVSGPIGPAAASVHLIAAPFRIGPCQAPVAPVVGFTDSGFVGRLTVSLTYATSEPNQVEVTCYASPRPFVDAAGRTVHSGALPTCTATAQKAPCVASIAFSDPTVTKTLLVPAGDPKVGAP